MRRESKRVLLLGTSVIAFVSFPLTSGNAQATTSRGETMFQPNSAIINPVDPDDGDEIEPTHPPTAGPLSINYASDIAFGQHKRKLSSEVFYAKDDIVTHTASGKQQSYPNFVQVTDLRGTATGWVLSVRQNGPLTNAEGEALVGAKLKVSAMTIESQSGMLQVPSGLVKEQVLTDDGTTYHPLVTAEAGTGLGTWTIFLGTAGVKDSNVSLLLPEKVPQKAGKYGTTLNWSLQDAL